MVHSRSFVSHPLELDMVQNAFHTAPEDQSTWFYHRWRVGMCKKHIQEDEYQAMLASEIEKIADLLEEEPPNKCPICRGI